MWWLSRFLPTLFTCSFLASAQEFQINEIRLDPQGGVVLLHPSDTNSYYILYRGDAVTEIVFPVDMALGEPAVLANIPGRLADHAPLADTAFYRVLKVSLSQPRDSDGDGFDDVTELRLGSNPLANDPLTSVRETSPLNGESGVSVLRETIVRFAAPLSTNAVVTTNNFYAGYGGQHTYLRHFRRNWPEGLSRTPGRCRCRWQARWRGVHHLRHLQHDAGARHERLGTRVRFRTCPRSRHRHQRR